MLKVMLNGFKGPSDPCQQPALALAHIESQRQRDLKKSILDLQG